LCSLFLCLLLCLANFSVVANAAESEENLVSSELSTWSDYSSIEDTCTPVTRFAYDSTNNYSNILISAPVTLGSYYALYDISSLSLGDTYRISFNITEKNYSLAEFFLEYFVVNIGLAYMDSEGDLVFDDGCWFELNSNNVSNFASTNNFDFKPTSIKGTPYLVIHIYCIQSYDGNGNFGLSLQNFSLTKLPSDESVKLDGILGWLQGIFDSISSLPETISTKFSTFFTNLENDITSLGDSIGGFFSDLKNKLSSEFSNLFASIAERWDVLDNFLLEIRNFFHDLYWDLVGGTCKYGDYHSSLFERLGDRISGFFDDLKLKIDLKVEEIKTSIHDFFVPPEGFFEDWKVKFDLMLSDNLGFIYDVPDMIIGFVNMAKSILDSDTVPFIFFPEVKFKVPGVDGGEIVLFEKTAVDFSFISESNIFGFLYFDAYPVLLHIIFIMALIGYAKYVWGRTMSN